ncbi:MAG: hypothetical protein ACI8PZ_003203 [Myxococcota bacterium]|jgi:hypothetical protein
MLVLIATLAFAVDITVSGDCPGEQTWTMSHLPEDGRLYLMAGTGPGDAPIPIGPCAGESSGLAGPLKPLAPLSAGPDARTIVFVAEVPEAACDMYATTVSYACETSAAVPVGAAGDCHRVCDRAVAAGCMVMEDCVDDCLTDLDICPEPMGDVLECHGTHAIVCDDAEDQGIGQRGCVDQHAAVDAECGIDPF